MAKESVLREAIKKLQYNSQVLKNEFRNVSCNSKRGQEILKELAKNDSMILDYEYRIKNNLG